MQVLHIQNPNALKNPMLVQLFKEALEAIPDAAPGGFESCAEDVFTFINDPGFVTVAGVEDGEFVALMIVLLPNNNIFPYPHIFLFYNRGSKEVRDAVKQRCVDIVMEKGYTHYRTANMSGHSDKAWEKVMATEGLTFTKSGSVYDIKVS